MEIAHTAWPANHPGYDHVKYCSPCLREMLDMRREIILARTRRRYRTYRIGIAAVLVLAAGIGFIRWSGVIHHQEGSVQQAVIARWDLQNASPSRDFNDYQQPVHLEAPAKRGAIAVTLPLGSEPGEYEVEVRRDRNGRAIKDFKSIAALSNQGKTVLQITADFSELPAWRLYRGIPPWSAGLAFRAVAYRLATEPRVTLPEPSVIKPAQKKGTALSRYSRNMERCALRNASDTDCPAAIWS